MLRYLVLFVVFAGCSSPSIETPVEQRLPQLKNDGYVESNTRREDYAGSDSCMRCHVERHMHWDSSPMRNMTRSAGSHRPKTPFDSTFTFKGETVRLFEQEKQFFMEIQAERTGHVTYHVTRIIGGTYREDFAGVAVQMSESGPIPVNTGHQEWILPISYMIETGEFRYKGYSVLVRERPGIHVSAQWNQTCVFCHNTTPALLRSLGGLVDDAPGYQASFVDDRLPAELQYDFRVLDPAELAQSIKQELDYLDPGATPAGDLDTLIRQTIHTSKEKFSADHVTEIGIGCESCHHGSAEHVADTNVKPSFQLRSTGFSYGPPERKTTRAEDINRVCAQCHSVLFSRYMPTWEGGLRRKDPGGSPVNSGEARDFLMGGCANQMSCTACHNPHSRDVPTHMQELRTVQGNPVCTTCHTQYAEETALAAHTHHSTDSDGSACLACHMPEKNLSLNTTLTTYHRIGSPTDPERIENDRPIECALCHADKAASELVEVLQNWWPSSTFDPDKVLALYPSNASVMLGTFRTGRPHEQAVAMHILADSKHPNAVNLIAANLTHPLPHLRYHALKLLGDLTGELPTIDLHQEMDGIKQDTNEWLETRYRRQ